MVMEFSRSRQDDFDLPFKHAPGERINLQRPLL
jgi:hypothetical protein